MGGRRALLAPEKFPEPTDVRFVGFYQANTVRFFHFEVASAPTKMENYTVSADMTLFKKHHVHIQEGPALCSRVLLAELASGRTERSQLVLTEEDILAHVASRPIPKSRKIRRRGYHR